MNSKGLQCTVCVHIDDLLIMSKSKSMINELTDGLTKRYGEISLKHGPVINYLGMVLDFTHTRAAKVMMSGYTDDLLKSSGIPGTARTPGTDGLFNTALPVPEEVRVWFHKHVAMALYLARAPHSRILPSHPGDEVRCRQADPAHSIHKGYSRDGNDTEAGCVRDQGAPDC
jgi:hypothetical protein